MNNLNLLQYPLLSYVKKPLGLFPKVLPLNNCFYDSSNDPTEFNHTLFNLRQFFSFIVISLLESQIVFFFVFEAWKVCHYGDLCDSRLGASLLKVLITMEYIVNINWFLW